MMLELLTTLIALVAINAQPVEVPDKFTHRMHVASEVAIEVQGDGAFIGRVWPCYKYDDETCYAGIIISDGDILLETGP